MKKYYFVLFASLVYLPFTYAQSFSALVNYGHQHNPRAEAMGRSHTGLEGDINSILYNPLTIAYLDDLQLSYSRSSPYDQKPLSKISYFAIGTKINKSVKFGLAYRHISQPYNFIFSNIETLEFESAVLTLGFKLSKHIYLGVGSNFLYSKDYISFIFSEPTLGGGYKALGLNNHIGFSGKYFLKNKRTFFTTSLKANWNYNSSTFFGSNQDLWSALFTVGSSFHYSSNKLIFNKYRAFSFIATIETTKNVFLFYSEENRSFFKFSLGNEYTILDYLSLRLGLAYWNVDISSSYKVSKKFGFTYGLGFKLPVHEFISQQRPINFYLDYCYLPHYFYNNIDDSLIQGMHNFQSISLRMSVNFKNKNTKT